MTDSIDSFIESLTLIEVPSIPGQRVLKIRTCPKCGREQHAHATVWIHNHNWSSGCEAERGAAAEDGGTYSAWVGIEHGYEFDGHYLPGHFPIVRRSELLWEGEWHPVHRIDCTCGAIGGESDEAFVEWAEQQSESWYSHLLDVLRIETLWERWERTGEVYND